MSDANRIPGKVNGRSQLSQDSQSLPTGPRGPRLQSRKKPSTVGGSSMGSMMSDSINHLQRVCVVASQAERGIPSNASPKVVANAS
jgi:hypothetical protein